MVEIDADMLFTVLYGLVALFNVTIFGNAAEACDLVNDIPGRECGSRAKAVIGFAVLTFLVSVLMFGAMVLRLSVLDSVHIFVTPLLFALNTVVAAIAISPRFTTIGTGSAVAIEIAWWAETICFILIIISFSDHSKPAPPKPGLEATMAPEPHPGQNTSTAPGPVQYQPVMSPETAPDV